MRRRNLILAGIAGSLAFGAGGVLLWWRSYERQIVTSRVPAAVSVDRLLDLSSDGYCGAAIFAVSSADSGAIRAGDIDPRHGAVWRPTPLTPDNTRADGSLPIPRGVDCATGLGVERRAEILRYSADPGSLFLSDPRGLYILIPAKGWLVYGFYD